MMEEESFNKRYIYRLSSSFIVIILNVFIQILLPKLLSVEDYGYYTYNLNVFTAVVGILNLQTSDALVAKFSNRNEEIGLIKIYYEFNFLIYICSTLLLFILYNCKFIQISFSGQTLLTVLLAFQTVYATRMFSGITSLFDCMAISKFPSIMQVILKTMITIVIGISFFMRKLTLCYFYIVQLFVSCFVSVFMLYIFIKVHKGKFNNNRKTRYVEYIKEFYFYCRPLVLINFLSQGMIIFMNWLLMHWGGVVNQAMFGIAWQLNTMVSQVFSVYAELSKREFSILRNNLEKLKQRYIKSLKLMMWITCYFSIFIGVVSDWLLPIVFGNKYQAATKVIFIIMLYTIYQSWGQISGALQLALEKTRIFAIRAVIGYFISIFFVFLFQIPNTFFPEGLGAIGIGLSYFSSNYVTSIIAIVTNARIVKSNWIQDLTIQFLPITICFILIIVIRYILNYLIPLYTSLILLEKVIIAGFFYTLIIGGLIWLYPNLIGSSRKTIRNLVEFKRRNDK